MSGWADACLTHLCSEHDRTTFERDGYLVIPDALGNGLRDRLRTIAERADAAFRADDGIDPYHVLNVHDLVGRDDAYLELVDLPTTFPTVWAILGWHIQLFHTQLLVTPPAPPNANGGAYGWHQDNNRMNLDLATSPQPRVSVKVGYFLSDLPEPGMGNLCVVPGSQTAGRPRIPMGAQPEGAVEILARAGDAIVFDRRIWHSASTNLSSTTRIFVTVGYSYRWLRPKSRMELGAFRDTLSPIRRQLLGATTSANAWFDPDDADVPLRDWIRNHVGAEAVVA